MRIISKFKDYYDNIVGYDTDPKLTYLRETKEIDVPHNDIFHKEIIEPIFKSHWRDDSWIGNDYNVIAFCGKVYQAYSFRKTFYSIDDVEAFINSDVGLRNFHLHNERHLCDMSKSKFDIMIGNLIKEDKKKWNNYWDRSSTNRKPFKVNNPKSLLDHDKLYNGKAISDNLFRHYNTPAIAISGIRDCNNYYNLTINPKLSDYNFQIKFDPCSAFQEIAMYLGNNLAKQNDPSIDFSDELKRDIAGFDNWSFRKQSKNSKL
jgi:hypothetical protein